MTSRLYFAVAALTLLLLSDLQAGTKYIFEPDSGVPHLFYLTGVKKDPNSNNVVGVIRDSQKETSFLFNDTSLYIGTFKRFAFLEMRVQMFDAASMIKTCVKSRTDLIRDKSKRLNEPILQTIYRDSKGTGAALDYLSGYGGSIKGV